MRCNWRYIHPKFVAVFAGNTYRNYGRAIAAADAGAAILHIHARDPQTGKPTQSADVIAEFLPRMKAETNAIVNITTGGSSHMTVEERMQPAMVSKPEIASLNMGTRDFGLYPMLNRFSEFTRDWERQHLENSRDLVLKIRLVILKIFCE